MCIRKVEVFEGLDGGHYKTEREALIGSIASVIESCVGDVERHIVPNLPKLLPLFQKLTDPRNSSPRPALRDEGDMVAGEPHRRGVLRRAPDMAEPVVFDDTAISGDQGVNEALAPATVEWGSTGDLSVEDLRPGQVLELSSGWSMTIKNVTPAPDDEIDGDTVIEGSATSADGSQTMAHLAVLMDGIVRIAYQPEELLSLDDARTMLAELEADPGPANEAALRHKRKILLHRRITELEGAFSHG